MCVVYLDEMFLFNVIMDYILLSLCNRISLGKGRKRNIFISALLGGLFSCIGYIFRLHYVFGVLFALVCSFVAFGFSLKTAFLLIVLSSLYSGLLEVLSEFIGINTVNGFGYIDFSLALLVILSLLIYFPVKLCFFIYNRKNSNKTEKAILMTEKGNLVFDVIIDSGCTLSCGTVPVLLVSSRLFNCQGSIPVNYKTVDSNGEIMCSYYSAFVGRRYFDKVAVGTIDFSGDEYQGIFPMYALGM